jgi:hypothetical protein
MLQLATCSESFGYDRKSDTGNFDAQLTSSGLSTFPELQRLETGIGDLSLTDRERRMVSGLADDQDLNHRSGMCESRQCLAARPSMYCHIRRWSSLFCDGDQPGPVMVSSSSERNGEHYKTIGPSWTFVNFGECL